MDALSNIYIKKTAEVNVAVSLSDIELKATANIRLYDSQRQNINVGYKLRRGGRGVKMTVNGPDKRPNAFLAKLWLNEVKTIINKSKRHRFHY